MNVLVLTDFEGIPGVTDIDFIDRTGEKYRLGCRFLEKSINLVTQTCLDFGAEKVFYLDGHGGGGNVSHENIHPSAQCCCFDELEALLQSGSIDCVIELGSHARAGTIGGFLDHTVSSKKWFSHRVNGIEMSELSMHALLFGAYGVPIAACIGDEAACMQAKEYIPEIVTGAVKSAKTRNLANLYENTDEIIVDTVRSGLKCYRSIPPYCTQLPATVELTYYRTDFCESALAKCGPEVERTDARTLRKKIVEIKKYRDLKFG